MIYADFWDLHFPPFANDNRPETFVPTRSATLAAARLRYALGTETGASALFGAPGTGKSRVARIVVEEFVAAHWLAAYLPSPHGQPRDILAALDPAVAALLPAGSDGLAELRAFLVGRTVERRPVLLVVDDAQIARGSDFLELLRTLLNIEHDGTRAMSLLLVGQASLERRLAAASGFDSQLAVRAVLEPMSDEETRLYILARLKAAGSRQGIFTRQAAERVVRYSRGVPRQINRLCELSLVVAYGLGKRQVSPDIVEMAAADLDLLPAGEASFLPWPHPAPKDEPGPEEPHAEDILAGLPVAEA